MHQKWDILWMCLCAAFILKSTVGERQMHLVEVNQDVHIVAHVLQDIVNEFLVKQAIRFNI
jgi:hypothetical protein